MATQTTNYNLSKPEATDPFSQFRQSYNDNLDIIDANLGGGGGSGGHTILDPNGSALPQEDDLQFTGAVSVSDDNVNGRTVVNISGGTVYGAFIDTDRVIASGTFAGSLSYTATEDSFAVVGIVSDNSSEGKIYVDGVVYTSLYNTGGSSVHENMNVYLRKGQVMSITEGNGGWSVSYTVYGLKQGTNGIFAPVIYSDTERVIGVWRDNKPLYQKTLVLNNLNLDASGTAVDISSLGVEMCSPIYAGSYYVVSGVIRGFARLEYQEPNDLYLYPAVNRTNTTCYITIQYTKTADVAGSGNWNTDGVPTVHYSTSEQVIGTWIDGKPLYMRSYKHTLANAPDEDTESFYVGDVPSDIDTLVKMDGTVKSPNAYAFCGTTGLPYVVGWNYSFHLNPSNHLAVWSTGNYSYYQHIAGGVAVVTIQYTKTTD